jgi:hypothetical protein
MIRNGPRFRTHVPFTAPSAPSHGVSGPPTRAARPTGTHVSAGRKAIKHAVRNLLRICRHGPPFPIQVEVANDAIGRPLVSGAFSEDLHVGAASCLLVHAPALAGLSARGASQAATMPTGENFGEPDAGQVARGIGEESHALPLGSPPRFPRPGHRADIVMLAFINAATPTDAIPITA